MSEIFTECKNMNKLLESKKGTSVSLPFTFLPVEIHYIYKEANLKKSREL